MTKITINQSLNASISSLFKSDSKPQPKALIEMQKYYNCGSQLYAKRENTAVVILRLGSLNDASIITSGNRYQEAKHIWLSQKACWYPLENEIKQFSEF